MGEKTEHNKLNEIFSQALEIDENQREKFLDEVCQDNPNLRQRVESLLKSFAQSDDFIEKPVIQVSQIQSANSAEINSNPKSRIPNPKSLRGDLDNIILMALRKESSRRYASVSDFSNDISNYLNGLPVSARPNTFKYRATKFIQRNKISVIAASLILLAILSGGIISFVQYRQTQKEKAKVEEVKNFLEKMLLTANPRSSGKSGYSSTINDMLEQATKQLESEELANQPEVKGELEFLLAQIYLSQGQFQPGEKYAQAALETYSKQFGINDRRVLPVQIFFASLYFYKTDYDRAEKYYEKHLPAVRREFDNGNFKPNLYLSLLNEYALFRRAKGESKEAEKIYREILSDDLRDYLQIQERNAAQLYLDLTLLDQGKFDEVEVDIRKKVAEIRQSADTNSIVLADNLTLLGSVLMEKNNLSEANTILQEAEKLYRKSYSPTHNAIFDNLRLQAQVTYLLGDYPLAEKQISLVLENYRQNFTPKYISYATALTIQGLTLHKLSKNDEAEKILREAVQIRTENLPANHFMTALTKSALGEVLTTNKKFEEAKSLLTESLDSLKDSQAGENQRLVLAKSRLEKLEISLK